MQDGDVWMQIDGDKGCITYIDWDEAELLAEQWCTKKTKTPSMLHGYMAVMLRDHLLSIQNPLDVWSVKCPKDQSTKPLSMSTETQKRMLPRAKRRTTLYRRPPSES